MMLSAVTMGFLALLGLPADPLELVGSGGLGVKVMLSSEAAPLDRSALPWRSSSLSNMSSSSRAVLMDLSLSWQGGSVVRLTGSWSSNFPAELEPDGATVLAVASPC